MTAPPSSAPAAIVGLDPQRRAGLEAERDQLLRSLDDLDAEYAAGELDQHDFENLRDGYTARAAEVLRQLAGPETPGVSAGTGSDPSSEPRPRPKRIAMVGALAVLAVVAGYALAQAAGERGVNDSLTGAIDPSSRTRVLECQTMGSTGGDLVGALQCFDEILAGDPKNAEALTYRGWYLLLAAGSLQDTAANAGDSAQADELTATGLSYLDRAIAADPELPDPLAFRATVHDRQAKPSLVCVDIASLLALNPPQFFVDQTSALAKRNNC